MLAKREVIYVDIATDLEGGVKSEWDPKTFQSKTTGRGPLVGPRWWEVVPSSYYSYFILSPSLYFFNRKPTCQ